LDKTFLMKKVDFSQLGSVGNRRMALIGGFLGAGKTTIIGCLTRWLESHGKRVGLVTNDQGIGLMDTATAQMALSASGRASSGSGVEEIAGGCFCCRLEELVGAIERLDGSERPDVIVAEPVGSCTDLMATVMLPLEQIYKMPFVLSPLSVVLDAKRALATLGGTQNRRSFHRDVGYVFRKQIEEAEWLVVNKVDLLDAAELEDLAMRLAEKYPGKRVFMVSARTGAGLDEWFHSLMATDSAPAELMEVDYERYAEGEALLGWVNSEAICTTRHVEGFDWGGWLARMGGEIVTELETAGAEVGHFKMSVETGDQRWRFHQVMSGEAPGLHEDKLTKRWEYGTRLLVNMRAEGRAELLEAMVNKTFNSQADVAVEFIERAAFQPGKPEPTHRMDRIDR
jgi:G3E family GTPase